LPAWQAEMAKGLFIGTIVFLTVLIAFVYIVSQGPVIN
jgi:hypothetical protein